METSSPATPLRYWFSLLTSRWHTSSRVVMVLMFLFLAFCNVPGQHVKQIQYKVGHPFYVDPQFEHGWPLTYLVRPVTFLDRSGYYPERTVLTCFKLWDNLAKFRPWMLLADVCVMLLASLAMGIAVEAWRRARSHVWQVHLKDLLTTTLVLSLIGARYFYAQQRYAAQDGIFRSSLGLSPYGYQEGGTTWLRFWLGDQAFQFLDRPFGVTVYEDGGWAHLEGLTSVRHIQARILCTTEELSHLAELPQLEALSLGEPDEAKPDNEVAQLPPLRKLRGLYMWQRAHRYRGINRLTSLEAIRIGEGCIDDTVLQEISALPNVRELALNGLSESAAISFLPSLPKLSALDFYHSAMTDAALQNIGQCPRLKELSLYMCHVDGSGVRHLSSLTNLETLDLRYTNVTSRDLAELMTLKRLRQFELTGTKVGGDFDFMSSLESLETLALYSTKVSGDDLESLVKLKHLRRLDLGYTNIGATGITHLRQMRQLKWLRVSIGDNAERKALQAALPECEVQFH